MMQAELLQLWPDSTMEEVGLYFGEKGAQLGSFEFSSSMEEFSYADDSQSLVVYGDNESPVLFPMEQCLSSLEEVQAPLSGQFTVDELKGLCEWVLCQEDAKNLNVSPVSSDASLCVESSPTSLVLPCNDMEIDDHLSILHLLKAYGEAMELEQEELAREVIRRLKEKASPIGAILERVSHHLIQALEKQVNYLSTQSSKNSEAAFKAFYQIFPYGRFAHFAANSAILDSIPEYARIVHIVDFDIGKGIQWPSLIEDLARKGRVLVRLISIKWEEEDCSCCFPLSDSFIQMKKRLHEHARVSGLRLKVEEMDMEDLVTEMKKIKRRGGRQEWLSFNCMVDLPHMGKVRSVRHVTEFLKVAKDSINDPFTNFNGASRGIITVGNVIEVEKLMVSSGFGSCFEGKLLQLQAFFESMEWHFPADFTEARMTMECLFMSSQVSYLTGSQKWEETTRQSRALEAMGLRGWRMSRDNVHEAQQLVREGESLYWIRTDAEIGNQMVLGYMGTPLVRVSSWK